MCFGNCSAAASGINDDAELDRGAFATASRPSPVTVGAEGWEATTKFSPAAEDSGSKAVAGGASNQRKARGKGGGTFNVLESRKHYADDGIDDSDDAALLGLLGDSTAIAEATGKAKLTFWQACVPSPLCTHARSLSLDALFV